MMKKKAVRQKAGGYSLQNRIELVHGGKEFFERVIELIAQSEHCIHFQTYIFADDKAGNEVADALIEAAHRKVKICLVADGFASQGLPRAFIQKMTDAGIRFRYFEPFLRSRYFYFGRRLHHKVIVIDGIKSLVGSMNIAERYYDMPEHKAWFDLALHVEGEAAVELHHICNKFWPRGKKRGLPIPPGVDDFVASIPKKEACEVRVRQNDWVKRKREATSTYLELLRTSKESITILSAYFLPGKYLRKELERAVARNVKVNVVLAGTSDIKVIKLAERYLYRWMLHHNICVYEYQPVVLHTKTAISDHHLVTLGSYNVNDLSAMASIELNLDIKDERFSRKMQKEIDRIIEKDCKRVEVAPYTKGLFSFRQFFRWFAFQATRLSLTLSTFYFRQRE